MSENRFNRPEVQVNLYKKSNPVVATVIEKKALTDNDDGEVHHIVVELKNYPFLEGQSLGVLAPGISDKGKTHNVRLYSIASLGSDLANDDRLVLCVKRLIYQDENGQKQFGVCSNYLCDLKVGDQIKATGPLGRKFLLPLESEIRRPYVFIATGTGIAPFRPMVRRLLDHIKDFQADVYLFSGGRYQSEILYDEEFRSYSQENFHYFSAISREQKNKQGGRRYVGDALLENEEIMAKVFFKSNSLIYLCGLKGMKEKYDEALLTMAKNNNFSEEEIENVHSRTLVEVY